MDGKDYIDKMKSHQYKDIYKSDDVPFHDLSTGINRKLISYGIVLFIVLLILSFIIKIPREVHIPFELKGGLSETIFQYPEIIYIEEFKIQSNDTIAVGDTLVKITSPKIVNYIEEYETWKSKMGLYQTQKKEADLKAIALLTTTIKGLDNEISKVEHEKSLAISASKKETSNLQLQVTNAENQHKRNISLHNNQVISDSDLEISEQKVQFIKQNFINRKESYALQVAEFESLLQKLRNTKSENLVEIDKQQALFDYEMAIIDRNLSLAKKKIELNYGTFAIANNSIALISSVKGLVSLRTETEYEVPSGEIILRIQTDSLNYYAYAEAGAKDIGHVKTGTKAVLKYKSFPHYYYGTMSAEVLSISNSPAENGIYPVKLKITETGKLKSKVTKGMTGTASFVVEENSIFNFILRSFLKATTID